MKNIANVLAIMGDNTSTNKAFARKAGPSFLGCFSHRYNLDMKEILSAYSEVVGKVELVTQELMYQIPAA